jgi:hypothetical protein
MFDKAEGMTLDEIDDAFARAVEWHNERRR